MSAGIHATVPTPDTVVLEVTVPADRLAVWRAFTEPTVLAAWFWPTRFGTEVAADVRTGGRWRIHAAGLGEDAMGVSGTYDEVEAPERFSTTWTWDGEPATTKVTVALAGAAGATGVRVTHSDNPTDASTQDHLVGWTDCLGRLLAQGFD